MNYPRVRAWEILVRPCLWYRNRQPDADFEQFLSDALDRGEPIALCESPLSDCIFNIEIAGQKVWIENAPYADATAKGAMDHAASRRTALRLRRAVGSLMRELYRFIPPSTENKES